MGRRAQGFRLFYRGKLAYVRFTHGGTDYRIPLGTPDPREAEARARAEFAAIISGRKRRLDRSVRSGENLEELLAEWVSDQEGLLDETTCATLEIYARHYARFFVSLDRITSASGVDYARARLRSVLRTTVLKELSFLRAFLTWCVERGVLVDVPAILPPKRGATGQRSGPQRSRPVEITEAQARAIIAALPPESKTIDGRRWPVRARFLVAWETGLRPTTLARLSVPEHYRTGAGSLVLEDADDKARFGRDLPLSPAARAALDASLPPDGSGRLFGAHRFDKHLKRAAAAVLGPHEARKFAAYDFRHGLGTHLVDEGAPLTGVAYLLGHKRMSTTDRYVRPNRRAAERALAAGGIAAQNPPSDSAPEDRMHPNTAILQGDRRGSNPRHLEPQSSDDRPNTRNESDLGDPNRADLGHAEPAYPPNGREFAARAVEALGRAFARDGEAIARWRRAVDAALAGDESATLLELQGIARELA